MNRRCCVIEITCGLIHIDALHPLIISPLLILGLSDMSNANLRYLNSEQALADLAAFRVAMAKKFNLTSNQWISFGGSYPGSLSAWYRLKYPHLVDGK